MADINRAMLYFITFKEENSNVSYFNFQDKGVAIRV
jgi:hypothetical protein